MSVFENVAEFMKAIGQECIQSPVDEVPEPGTGLPPHTLLYQDLVTEEYEEAKNAENLTDVVDAICDLIWVLCGFAYSFGVRPDILKECWDEVYRSNMDKLNGPIAENGKRLKPEGWQGPRIAEILERHRKAAE